MKKISEPVRSGLVKVEKFIEWEDQMQKDYRFYRILRGGVLLLLKIFSDDLIDLL